MWKNLLVVDLTSEFPLDVRTLAAIKKAIVYGMLEATTESEGGDVTVVVSAESVNEVMAT